MYLAARLFLFFASSDHSIRNRHARACHVATNRIAMTVGTMSTRILAIRSRVGQRKSTATTCICVHSHPSSSPSDTSFQLYRRSFISVKLSVYLSRSKNSLMETVYMRSPFMERLPLRVSFHAPHGVIFHSQTPSFSICRRLLYICRLFLPRSYTYPTRNTAAIFSDGSRMVSTRVFPTSI